MIRCAPQYGRNLTGAAWTVAVTTASNPEFLKEGFAVEDFMKPDRIIVGVDDSQSAEIMRQLYAPFNRNRDRLIVMDIRSAEFTKYAANCMLGSAHFVHERDGKLG